MVPEKMPYQLEKWLGQGTSATVFLASRVDEVSGARQQVAIKFLNSEKLVEAWRQELQSLQQVDSPIASACWDLSAFPASQQSSWNM